MSLGLVWWCGGQGWRAGKVTLCGKLAFFRWITFDEGGEVNLRLTERDIAILRWVNAHRYARAEQIFKRFGLSRAIGYRRLKLLVQHGYLVHEIVFHGQPGHYRVTAKGVAASGDELSAPREVPLSSYRHDIMLVDLALELVRKTGGTWITERQLRHQLGLDKVGRVGKHPHVPDGVLQIEQNGRAVVIAVELELSHKVGPRLQRILENYAVSNYSQVLYCCSTWQMRQKIQELAARTGAGGIVKAVLVTEILNPQNSLGGCFS